MDYATFTRVLTDPYWCKGSPLKWQAKDTPIGLAHFALEGKVGMFNLCWFMLQRSIPPLRAEVYGRANLGWVIQFSSSIMIHGCSMEQHASMTTLTDFRSMLATFIRRTHSRPVDFPGSVPWKTLYDISTKTELT